MRTLDINIGRTGTWSDLFPAEGRPRPSLLTALRRKWNEHRLLQAMQSMPFDAMKDVGFPAAERMDGQ
jgi:hypothetical protein